MKVIVIALFCIAAITAADRLINEEVNKVDKENSEVVTKHDGCLRTAGTDQAGRDACFTTALESYNPTTLKEGEQEAAENLIKFASTKIMDCANGEDTAGCIRVALKEESDLDEETKQFLSFASDMLELNAEVENALKKEEQQYNETHECTIDQDGVETCVLNDKGTDALKAEFEEYKVMVEEVYQISKEDVDERFTIDFVNEEFVDKKAVEEIAAYEKKQEEINNCVTENGIFICESSDFFARYAAQISENEKAITKEFGVENLEDITEEMLKKEANVKKFYAFVVKFEEELRAKDALLADNREAVLIDGKNDYE